jgi:hypothetical protein
MYIIIQNCTEYNSCFVKLLVCYLAAINQSINHNGLMTVDMEVVLHKFVFAEFQGNGAL